MNRDLTLSSIDRFKFKLNVHFIFIFELRIFKQIYEHSVILTSVSLFFLFHHFLRVSFSFFPRTLTTRIYTYPYTRGLIKKLSVSRKNKKRTLSNARHRMVINKVFSPLLAYIHEHIFIHISTTYTCV